MKRKTISRIIIMVLVSGLCFMPGELFPANNVTITGVSVTDSSGNERTIFSSTERINLAIKCNNTVETSRIEFKFYVNSPGGSQVFRHTGNSIVGKIGAGGSKLSNVPVSGFYKTPGVYTFKGEIKDNDTDTKTFSVYSPAVILSYPANGTRNMIDRPLVFRWISSGATKYRVYVDDDQSFYRTIWSVETGGNSIGYPVNPTDPKQKLAAGVVYWWKVEGISNTGNIVATTPIPFSFSLKDTAPPPSTKDLAVLDIVLDRATSEGKLYLRVLLKNLGGQPEANVPVDLYFNGASIISGQRISSININEVKALSFICPLNQIPNFVSGAQTLISAIINYSDDNTRNNILTKTFRIEAPAEGITRVSGTVFDKKNKKLENVTVSYSGTEEGSELTDANGFYEITGISPGKYDLKAGKHGYVDSGVRVVNVEEKKLHTGINFELRPEGKGLASIKGRVHESGPEGIKKAIKGAVVEFAGPVSGSVKTNRAGRYLIKGLSSGEYTLKVTHKDYKDSSDRVVEVTGEEKVYEGIVFELTAGEEEDEPVTYTKEETWEILGELIEGKFIEQLKGYKLKEIILIPDGDVNLLMRNIKGKKAKIIEVEIE